MPLADRFQDALDAARESYDLTKNELCKLKLPFPLPQFYGGLVFTLVIALGSVYALVVSLIVGSIAPFARAVFKIIADIRREGIDDLNALTVDSLSELMGVEFSTADLPKGNGQRADIASARAIGGKVHDLLEAEFTDTGAGTPKSGKDAARAFTGYVTRFGIFNAFTSILTDSVSLHHITQLRELGVEVAENMGLGRLHRRAMTPLVDNLIVKPYDRELRAKYRPDKLTDVQFIKAFQSGRIDEQTLRQELAYVGYKDAYIDELIAQLQLRLSDSEIETLLRYTNKQRDTLPAPSVTGQPTIGDIPKLTTEDAVKILVNQGMSEDLAKQRLVALGLTRADNEVQQFISIVEGKAADGVLSLDQAEDLIRSTPLSPEELHWRLAALGMRFEYPRKKLTLAEVRTAFENGVIDLDYWDRFLESEGYSDEDQLILLYQLLIDTKKFLDKETAARDRAARKAVAVKK